MRYAHWLIDSRLVLFRSSRPPAQDFDLCSGLPLRLVLAMRSSSSSLIDTYISFEGPFSSLFIFSPRLAASATPAACCCALDFAGMAMLLPQCSQDLGYALHRNVAALCPVPVPGTVRGTAQNPRGEPPGECRRWPPAEGGLEKSDHAPHTKA